MATVVTPISMEEATERLGSLERLLIVKEWEKAAILATFVRLPGRGTRRESPGSGVFTADEFAERFKLNGLQRGDTVRLYVQRWLDANDGQYPKPGEEVALPDQEWQQTSLDDSRYQAIEDREAIRAQATADGTGAAKAIDIAKNTKAMAAAIKASPAVAAAAAAALPPEVLAMTARSPEVAEAIHNDHEAATTMLKTSLERSSRGSQGSGGGGGRSSSGGGMVSAIEKALMQLGAVAYENTGRKMLQNLQTRHESELPWRPGERERLMKLIDAGIGHGQMAKTLLEGLSAEDLAELLGQSE